MNQRPLEREPLSQPAGKPADTVVSPRLEPGKREPLVHASLEVRSSIVYATVIVALVFLPLFMLTGVEGRLLAPLGLAYITSLVASLFVSLTVTPVLASYLLPQIFGAKGSGPAPRSRKSIAGRLRSVFGRRAAAGRDWLWLHDLRHACATFLLVSGATSSSWRCSRSPP